MPLMEPAAILNPTLGWLNWEALYSTPLISSICIIYMLPSYRPSLGLRGAILDSWARSPGIFHSTRYGAVSCPWSLVNRSNCVHVVFTWYCTKCPRISNNVFYHCTTSCTCLLSNPCRSCCCPSRPCPSFECIRHVAGCCACHDVAGHARQLVLGLSATLKIAPGVGVTHDECDDRDDKVVCRVMV